MTSQGGVTVLVTGGAGCLGQHIVKELLEQDDFPVNEIRTYDIQHFRWHHGLQPSKDADKLYHIKGDICNFEELSRACEGIDAVIHACSRIVYGAYPNKKSVYAINVEGTENVVMACVENSVDCLVYTSSMDVASDLNKSSVNTTEETATVPAKRPIFQVYSSTKYKAERLVLESHNKELKNGRTLATCSLRPCGIFGEGDIVLAENMAIYCNSGLGFRIGEPCGISQMAYAGNIGYLHMLAVKALLWPETGQSVGGRAFFLGDHTPLKSIGGFTEPFLEEMGVKMASITPPFWLMYTIALVLTVFCWLLSPFKNLEIPFHTSSVRYMFGVYYYNWEEVQNALGYIPKYNYDEAFKRSLAFYKNYLNVKPTEDKKKNNTM